MKKAILFFVFCIVATVTGIGQLVANERNNSQTLMKAEAISSSLVTMAGGKKGALAFHFNFDYDSAKIKPEFYRQLEEIGKALIDLEMKKYVVSIEGHTDSDGSDAYNMGLSIRRANAVKNYLTGRFDIPFVSLKTDGWGERKPMRRNDTVEGKATNRRVELIIGLNPELVEKPKVFVQLGHKKLFGVSSVAITPDGRYVVSKSDEKTYKLWDISTGREIRTFEGHDDYVTSIAITPDGRYVLSGSGDKNLRLWDISTGKEVRTFEGHSEMVQSVAISPNGRYALSGGYRILKLWDISTGREIRTFEGHDDYVISIAITPDGRYALSGSGYTFKLWDISTGREIRTFEGYDEHSSIAITPDGRYVLSGSEYETFKLWEISTGKEIRTFKGHDGYVTSVAITPDGRHALSGSWDNALKLWDISTGKEIRTFEGHDGNVNSIAITPDGRYVLSGSGDKTLKLWDISTGKEIRAFKGHSGCVESVAISPDGRYELSGGDDNTFKLWDIARGEVLRTFKGHSDSVLSVAISPDGRYALSGSWDKTLKLWDISTAKEIRTFEGHDGSVNSIVITSDGRYVLSGSGDKTLKLWDISTGKEIRTFKGHSDSVLSVAISPDGHYAVSENQGDNSLKIWDITTGQEIGTFDGHSEPVSSVAITPDGRYALSGSKTLKLWEISTGKEIRTFKGHSNFVSAINISPDGRYALSGSTIDGILKLWEISTGKEIRTFKGHSDFVSAINISPDGRYALSGSWDGTTRLWSLSSGKEIVQMVSFTNGEWITITPQGYYTCSLNGDKFLNVRIGNKVYGIDDYKERYYRPDIVEAAIRYGDSGRAVRELVRVDEQNQDFADVPPPTITILRPDKEQIFKGQAEIDLLYFIKDHKLPIKSIKITHNGFSLPVGRDIVRVKKNEVGSKIEAQVSLALQKGKNIIAIRASNGESASEEMITVFYEPLTQSQAAETIMPNLWLMAIGVSKYDHLPEAVQLNYADNDAEAISKIFKKLEGRLFRKVHSLVLTENSELKPTRANITDNLDFLSKASQYDTAVLFIAGHAVRDSRRNFYFLPSDARIDGDGDLQKSSAILYSQITEILEGGRKLGGRKLAFVDTCHSEGISGKKTRSIEVDELIKSNFQETGSYIFASSMGNEKSLEGDEWGHGVFTFSILQGLNGEADLIKDGVIKIKELDTYVSEQVPVYTKGGQHPITFAPEGYPNFVVYQ